MPQRYTKLLIALAALSAFFASCSKKSSSDEPLSPVYNPSVIVANDNRFVYAYNTSTGTKNWELNIDDVMVASPLLYNHALYLATSTGDIFKVNANTGKVINKFVGVVPIYATPIASGSLIYVAKQNDSVYAMDTTTMAIKWRFGTASGSGILSSPTLSGGQLIIAGTDGNVYSVDAFTGAQKWMYNAGASARFTSSPAVYGPYVFVGGSDSKMYCIYLTDGTLRWTFTAGGSIESSPTLYNGLCIFGADDYKVYCIDTFKKDADSSKAIWTTTTSDIVTASPYAGNQVVYAASHDGNLYALNIINGAANWTFHTTALLKSSPLAYGSSIYIGSYDKYMYSIDSATGTVIWQVNTNGVIQASPVVDNLSGNSYNSGISGLTN